MRGCQNRKDAHQAKIIRNGPLCADGDNRNCLLELRLDNTFSPVPGQFIQIQLADEPRSAYSVLDVTDDRIRPWATVQPALREKGPLLNRPFSIAGISSDREFSQVSVLYDVKGPGTVKLSTFEPSDRLAVFGPLGGHGFDLPADTDRVLAVAGGLGLAPLIWWTSRAVEADVAVSLLIGSATGDRLPLPRAMRERQQHSVTQDDLSLSLPAAFRHLLDERVDLHLATEDGSAGVKGRVTDVLEQLLASKPSDENWVVYSCGPWPMLRSVYQQSRRAGLGCQVSLEQMMACGIGTCQSCIVAVTTSEPPYRTNELCCTHGPVFDAARVIWE